MTRKRIIRRDRNRKRKRMKRDEERKKCGGESRKEGRGKERRVSYRIIEKNRKTTTLVLCASQVPCYLYWQELEE